MGGTYGYLCNHPSTHFYLLVGHTITFFLNQILEALSDKHKDQLWWQISPHNLLLVCHITGITVISGVKTAFHVDLVLVCDLQVNFLTWNFCYILVNYIPTNSCIFIWFRSKKYLGQFGLGPPTATLLTMPTSMEIFIIVLILQWIQLIQTPGSRLMQEPGALWGGGAQQSWLLPAFIWEIKDKQFINSNSNE